MWAAGRERKSDFFRDLAAAEYMEVANEVSDPSGVDFETLCGAFDAAILQVENATRDVSFETHIGNALQRMLRESKEWGNSRGLPPA